MISSEIIEIQNFVSDEESDYFKNFHVNNYKLLPDFLKKTHRETKIIQFSKLLREEKFNYLYCRIASFIQNVNKKYFPNYVEIVKWKKGLKQNSHLDFNYHPYTSIIYLNDDFEGGETWVEDKIIKPQKGKMAFFPGSKLNHGVKTIKEGNRFTIPVWYRSI